MDFFSKRLGLNFRSFIEKEDEFELFFWDKIYLQDWFIKGKCISGLVNVGRFYVGFSNPLEYYHLQL